MTNWKIRDSAKKRERLYEFLRQSNAIESEYSEEAFEDALEAWNYLVETKCTNPLEMILEAHKRLMRRLNPEIGGKLRMVNVRVGNRICPDWTLVPGLLSEWIEKYINIPCKTWTRIREAHIELNKIHIFEDGNGRCSRLIMAFQRIKIGLPILVIHIGEEQREYYLWWDE